MYWLGYEVRFLVGERNFSFLQNFQTGSGANPDSCWMSNGALPPGVMWQNLRLQVQNLTSLCAFMMHTGTTSLLSVVDFVSSVSCWKSRWIFDKGSYLTGCESLLYGFVTVVNSLCQYYARHWQFSKVGLCRIDRYMTFRELVLLPLNDWSPSFW